MDLLSFRDYNPPVPVTLPNGHCSLESRSLAFRTSASIPLLDLWCSPTPAVHRITIRMQMSWNNRLGRDLVGNLSYVYSRCTDGAYTYGGLGGNNGTSSWTNPYDGTRERGLCGFDIRHNLTLNVVYRLPFRGNRLMEGWQISGIESFHTGVPISVGIGYDRALLSNNFSTVRPDVIAGCDQTANQSVAHWFNAGLLHLTGTRNGRKPGQEHGGRTELSGRRFSLSKDTRIFERLNMQFRAEIFNIFNHTNFGTPGSLASGISTRLQPRAD